MDRSLAHTHSSSNDDVTLGTRRACDVMIAGGGMVGMSLAVALARAGIAVTVVEKDVLSSQREAGFDGRVSAIAYGSKCLLDGIGVWPGMAEDAEPILDIRVSDNGKRPFFLHYHYREAGQSPFGYIVENKHIRRALHQAAGGLPGITVADKSTVVAFEQDEAGMTVRLAGEAGETAWRCRLLVGADGKRSAARALAGIGAVEWNYRQTAIVCAIDHEFPHDGLAQERFLAAGPFAVLPMRGNRSSLVWVEPQERAELYLTLPQEDFLQEIWERVGGYLGAITAAGPRFSYPLSLMHAKSYVAPRLALIGDAAHAIHPIAGQGVNLGFRDVAVLAELITGRFRLGLDIGDKEMLTAYQRWRRFDNVAMLGMTDGLNRLFTVNLLPVRLARGIGMWAVGQIPPLKRFLMRHAMGMTGDMPNG